MKRKLIFVSEQPKLLLIIILLVANSSFGQTKLPNCNCPKSIYSSTKADTVFQLSNGKMIALCGYRDNEAAEQDGKVFFSEFVLSVCGDSKIIKFWGAVKECQVKAVKDTLFVETMMNLPTGKKMAFKWTVWTIERIYFVKRKEVKDFMVNRQIPKYNQQQIISTLKQYEGTKKKISNENMEISERLFVCAISGSQKARTYLINFKKDFGGLDGEYAEWYDDIRRRLKLWDTNIPSDDNF